MTLQDTVSALLKKQVSEAEAMQFASKQFGILAGFLQDKALEEKFPNGFVSWSETHFEIIRHILNAQSESGCPDDTEFWNDAREWATEFEKTFEGVEWDTEDHIFDELLKMFMSQKLKAITQ